MDDILNAFASASVSSEPLNTAAPHPHFSLYKVKESSSSQEERRRKFLESLKSKRYDYVNHARQLATNEWDTQNDKESEQSDEMECDMEPKRPSRSYKNQLMLSEWLVEVPEDLAENWVMVLCPVGKRSLVIASRGSTRSFSRVGYPINSFPSNLPGGRRHQGQKTGGRPSSYSIVDCIYSELHKTYFVLDVMCWNSHPLYDSDTEFRFYWRDAKIKENPEVTEQSSINPYKFVPLPYYTCDKESIKNVMWSSLPFPCQIDGVLFYHKKTHYTPGATPLIGWLKPFMLPEIIDVPVPETLCSDKPSTYTTMKEHVPKAFEKHQMRKELEEKAMACEESS